MRKQEKEARAPFESKETKPQLVFHFSLLKGERGKDMKKKRRSEEDERLAVNWGRPDDDGVPESDNNQ